LKPPHGDALSNALKQVDPDRSGIQRSGRLVSLTVRSPKTEKSGKAQRVVPLFPELFDELKSLLEIVGPGVKSSADGFVITRYRDSETNLRTMLGRITEQAGIVPWPKPFMALRASRRTELERSGRHPNHVLNGQS